MADMRLKHQLMLNKERGVFSLISHCVLSLSVYAIFFFLLSLSENFDENAVVIKGKKNCAQ